MSDGTVQERATTTLEQHDTHHERQQQLAADLQLEQVQKVD